MIKAIFNFLSHLLNDAEKSMLDFISVFVPWAVPIIPAYLTFYHTIEIMNFPEWVGWIAAFVVESLGLVSVATTVRFYYNNIRYKDQKEKAPFWMAFGVYLFYLIIVMVVNVLLEVKAGTRDETVILAIALFSLLSFPSGVLISIRVQYSEMLEHRVARGNRTASGHGQQRTQKTKHASQFRDRILTMLDDHHTKTGQVLSPKAIAASLNLDHTKAKGYISTVTSEWKKSKNQMGF
jgi:hypothetical protein